MQRRNFLKTAAAGAALAATGPYFLGAADKAGSKGPVLGSGEHRYECVHNWGELPADFPWQTTHGVCVDAAGLVSITHMGHDGKAPLDVVLVFDPKGKFVRSFGKDFFLGGHGIDVRNEGGEVFLYLCNMMPVRSVVKTTLKGEVVWNKSFPQEAKVYKDVNGFAPTNVALGADGGFYVGDGYGSNYIHDLAWRKKVLAGFKVRADEKQWEAGKFIHPHDACFDKDGNIFVVEWVQSGRVTLLKKIG
ncbi:MAG TPA: twin-arginine translocation signal domain-containing protein [Gemmataceae bacterium]|nr:twin-arginine translocation signal domain-containing protein [Gemmataceae bacterium]